MSLKDSAFSFNVLGLLEFILVGLKFFPAVFFFSRHGCQYGNSKTSLGKRHQDR